MSEKKFNVVNLIIIIGAILTIAIVIAVAITSNNSVETPSTDTGTNSNINTGTEKYTLLDLGSKGCYACDNLQPVLETLRTKYSNEIDIKFYDVNRTNEGIQLSNKYGIQFIPTLIFLDQNGKEVKRLVGFYTVEEFEKEFRALGWIE